MRKGPYYYRIDDELSNYDSSGWRKIQKLILILIAGGVALFLTRIFWQVFLVLLFGILVYVIYKALKLWLFRE